MKSLRLLLLFCAACCPAGHCAQLADAIRAVVSDTIITDNQVREHVSPVIQDLQQHYTEQPLAYAQKVSEVVENATQDLINRQLKIADFKGSGYNFPESMLDDAVREYIRKHYPDRVTMVKTMQAEGKTLERLRREIRENIIIDFLTSKNVSSAIIISPHKIEEAYKEHADKYNLEDQVKLRVIRLNSASASSAESRKRLADEIRTQIKGGADFAEMAKIYSVGSQAKDGGDWGWIDRKTLRPELSDVAFKMDPKQVSDVIESPEECTLLLVEEKSAAHVKPLSEVRDEIEKTLLIEEQSRLQKKYVDKLRNKTFFSFF